MEYENTISEELAIPGFTLEEVETYRKLNSKYKKIQRMRAAEQKFYQKADACIDALLQRWKEQVKDAYGHDVDDQRLVKYLTRDRAIHSFRDRLEASHVEGDAESKTLPRS